MKSLLALSVFLTCPAFADQTAKLLTFADGALIAEVSWLQGPHVNESSEMKIEWKNGTDQVRIEPPGPMGVSLWMRMHEHEHGSSPVTIDKFGDEPGVYKASEMYFTMTGAWQVQVHLQYPDGHEETQSLDVQIKDGHHH